MVVPSPAPAYNASYSSAHLASLGKQGSTVLPASLAFCAPLIAATQSDAVRGFLVKIVSYLADALAINPKCGHNQGARTALYGLQTPPLNGQLTYLRCTAVTSFDDAAPYLLAFFATTAWPQLVVSADHTNSKLCADLAALGINVSAESTAVFDARVQSEKPFNVITPALDDCFPLVGQFISLHFCVGHIKSTNPNDDAFIAGFSDSPKWLQLRRP